MTGILRGITIALIVLISPVSTYAQTISTIAGSGAYGFMTGSYGGDGGPATAAKLNMPSGLTYDATGNLYIADYRNGRIRKINPAGIITTFAGSGTIGYAGDGGPATAAEFTYPESIVFDAAGNLYVADRGAPSIRKIDPAGIITTVVGNGTFGYGGDGGPATAALLDNPCNVQVDAAGNLYICDWINGRLRKVNTSGIITTIAGNGTAAYSGDGSAATATGMRPSATLIEPSGNILVCAGANRRLLRIDGSGIVTTVAGTGATGYSGDGGPATAAEFQYPANVIYDPAGNLLVCDQNNAIVRKIDATGTITTIAGIGGVNGFSGDAGPATAAKLQFPFMMAFSPGGELMVSDIQNNRVRKIDFSGTPASTAINKVLQAGGINIYPNPVGDELHIEGLAAHTSYALTDMDGRRILIGNCDKVSGVLYLKTLAPGMYSLQLTSPAGDVRTVRVVKE